MYHQYASPNRLLLRVSFLFIPTLLICLFLPDVHGQVQRGYIHPNIAARIEADREPHQGTESLRGQVFETPEPGTVIFAFDTSRGRLVSFEASNPGVYLTDVPVPEINPLLGDYVEGIDFRPADGFLYGIASHGFPQQDWIVRIDPVTGTATNVHPTNSWRSLQTDIFLGL